MGQISGKTGRRFARIATPRGVWVAWQNGTTKQSVCRVCDLNVGGLFVATAEPAPLGSMVSLLMAVPEGEIRAHATVKNVKPGEGMGVQFAAMGDQDTERLHKLVTRLLEADTKQQRAG